jgi:hypothetical protein
MADTFDDAFASFLKDETPPVVATETPATETSATETPVVAAATETPAEVVATEGDLGGEPPPPEDTTPQTPPQDDALSRLADMLSQREAQRPQPQYQQPQQQYQPQSMFTPEEQAILTQYVADFPDVARAEALARRAEYGMLSARIYQEVANYFAPKLALLDQLADRTVYGDLTQRVPDYDDIRDKVVAWVQTQPAYLQPAYNHVIQQGTAGEITDLVDRYRQATGTVAPNPQPSIAPGQGGHQVTPSSAGQAPELSPVARQAAARLAPVSSKRSAPTQQAPLDYDAAFLQFAKAG